MYWSITVTRKARGVAKLYPLVTFLALITVDQGDCPPWFFPGLDNGIGGVCNSVHQSKVKCSGDTALLRIGNCLHSLLSYPHIYHSLTVRSVLFHFRVEFVLLKVMLALCGLWNLDFFRSIVPPFCVTPNMKNLHAFALEYTEAFYPLVPIRITYIGIKLYDWLQTNCSAVETIHRCFVFFRIDKAYCMY